MHITVLVENTARKRGLLAEHGLSVYIETGDRRILFDTGQSGIAVHNARILGCPIDQVDAVVLSHGHYDHTGGLKRVLESAGNPKVYAHPAAFRPKYACDEKNVSRPIGMPDVDEDFLRKMEYNSVSTIEPTRIGNGIFVTGEIPRVTAFEDTGGPFFLDEACSEPDSILDDQALFFESSQGIVVLLGCAHAGIINSLLYIRRLTGQKPIHAVLGGMHLLSASQERMDRTIDQLRQFSPDHLGPAHCTGRKATSTLCRAFGKKCSPCLVGTQIEFHQ